MYLSGFIIQVRMPVMSSGINSQNKLEFVSIHPVCVCECVGVGVWECVCVFDRETMFFDCLSVPICLSTCLSIHPSIHPSHLPFVIRLFSVLYSFFSYKNAVSFDQ